MIDWAPLNASVELILLSDFTIGGFFLEWHIPNIAGWRLKLKSKGEKSLVTNQLQSLQPKCEDFDFLWQNSEIDVCFQS